ncbi:MAG: dihydropteroate synthase [Lachnospiraceae bacterium]|nr:dihydropteroate synthase [Lachnospiraceae bacterium]
MIIIGENLNGSIPFVARAIAGKDEDWIRALVKKQADAGADFIDICAYVESGETETMEWMIGLAESVTEIPISIDSPDTEVLAKAYRQVKRPGLFNSVSMEKKKRIDQIFCIMRENPGWKVIAMLCDDSGIPRSAAKRLKIFDAIMEKAAFYGITPDRIYIDPIIEAAALMDPEMEDGPGIAVNKKVIETIRRRCPAVHITSAVSNISHSLPARRYMNYSFIVLALSYGLDSAILDPLDPGMPGIIKASEVLLGLPGVVLEQLSDAVKENCLQKSGFPKLKGFEEEEGRKALELAMTVLAMGAGAENVKPPLKNRDLDGMVYAARALLGWEEEGCCLEYIEAYREGLFGGSV